MSCLACETAQGMNVAPNALGELMGFTYVRVGVSNILIAGCNEHLRELILIFRKGLKSENA